MAALSLLPVHAAGADDHEEPLVGPYNVAVGDVNGVANIAAPGIPKLGESCEPTTFSMSISSNVTIAMNTVLSGYVGPVTMTGGGSGVCDSLFAGGGPISLSASGVGPTGSRLSCPTITGTFNRVGSVILAVVSGNCILNAYGTGQTTFFAVLQFNPEQGDGINTRVTRAAFRGAFVAGPLIS